MRKPAAARPRTHAKPVASPPPRRKPPKKLPAASAEVARPADRVQREMVDEYGELARQVQMFEPVQVRYELLKRAIKSWFDEVPADAEATVEGKVYLLNISPRERVRRIRDIQQLAREVGTDDLLDILAKFVPLGVIEDLIGKTKVAALVVDERTGSRRIKCVAKHPSAVGA
jgi:hypothetical protein